MDFMTKFRINLIAKFPYPYTTELFCNSNYIHLCSHKTLSSSSNQCCQLVYIYTKFQNFGIFSKCLVYMKNLVYFCRRAYLRFYTKLFILLQSMN